VTLIPPKPALKVVPLPIVSDLAEASLKWAAELAAKEHHDGWADLIVHQGALKDALRLAALHNATLPEIQLRVLTDTTLGRSDWKLKTRSAVVASLWTNKN
jgi:hypothetical protein